MDKIKEFYKRHKIKVVIIIVFVIATLLYKGYKNYEGHFIRLESNTQEITNIYKDNNKYLLIYDSSRNIPTSSALNTGIKKNMDIAILTDDNKFEIVANNINRKFNDFEILTQLDNGQLVLWKLKQNQKVLLEFIIYDIDSMKIIKKFKNNVPIEMMSTNVKVYPLNNGDFLLQECDSKHFPSFVIFEKYSYETNSFTKIKNNENIKFFNETLIPIDNNKFLFIKDVILENSDFAILFNASNNTFTKIPKEYKFNNETFQWSFYTKFLRLYKNQFLGFSYSNLGKSKSKEKDINTISLYEFNDNRIECIKTINIYGIGYGFISSLIKPLDEDNILILGGNKSSLLMPLYQKNAYIFNLETFKIKRIKDMIKNHCLYSYGSYVIKINSNKALIFDKQNSEIFERGKLW